MTLRRILALPTATVAPLPDLTTPGGTWTLRPTQTKALGALLAYRGLLGSIGVGEGKTLIAALAGTVLGVDRVLAIVPAHLRTTMRREFDTYAEHFRITPPRIMSYAELSQSDGEARLNAEDWQCVVLDEAHYLRSPRSARTRRFARWRKSHPDVPMCAMSGTLTARSLVDYAHLSAWTLGDLSPLPLHWSTLEAWAACIDVQNPHRTPTRRDWDLLWPLVKWAGGPDKPPVRAGDKRHAARKAFHLRLSTAPGVVTTDLSTYQGSLEITTYLPPVPEPLQRAWADLEDTWTLPDGTYLTTALEMDRARRQLSQGYFATFDWGSDGPDTEWLRVRSEWAVASQKAIHNLGHKGIDTPGTLIDAINNRPHDVPTWTVDAWRAWESVKDTYDLDAMRVVTWLDDSLLRWIADNTPKIGTLIWASDVAVLERLQAFGVKVVWPKEEPPSNGATCALSIWSHGTGKNLQAYHENLVLNPPSSGQRWEQLIGRTHRPGQTEDTVRFILLTWHGVQQRSIVAAKRAATYLQKTTGQRQKLLSATWV